MSDRGKKIAVWKYEKDKGTIDVPVYLVDTGGRGRRYDEPKTFFRVRLSDPGIDVENANIDELKKQVWKELDDKLSIKWLDFLYVTVDGDVDPIVRVPDPDEEEVTDLLELVGRNGRCEVSVKYERVQLGELNGQKMHRDFNNYHEGTTYYSSAREDWPDVGKEEEDEHGYRRRGNNEMRAMVADTAENRAALDEITKGFGVLMKRLSDLLSPEQAQKTLVNVGSLKFLPDAERKPVSSKKN